MSFVSNMKIAFLGESIFCKCEFRVYFNILLILTSFPIKILKINGENVKYGHAAEDATDWF